MRHEEFEIQSCFVPPKTPSRFSLLHCSIVFHSILIFLLLQAFISDDGMDVIIPRSKDVPTVIICFYNKFRGENSFKLWSRIRSLYANISRVKIQDYINSSEEHCAEFPVFRNKGKLKAVVAHQPMDQVQVDLVDFSAKPSASASNKHRYVFAWLDVFSRYLVLAPVTRKTPKEAAALFLQTVMQFGVPKRLQTDQGSEFKGKAMNISHE